MQRYLGTFSRHKIALLLPILITVIASLAYARSAPKSYTTTMNLYFDTATPNASSLTQLPNGETPAAQGQSQLQEFIGTAQFLTRVGRLGPLAAEITKAGVTNPAVVNADILSALSKAFTATTTGPQVVQVTMTSHDPSYMVGTLQAVATAYSDEVSSTLASRGTASVTYYSKQVQAAGKVVEAANTALDAYQAEHPRATTFSDATLNQLSQVASQDQSNLTTLRASLQGAQLSLQNVQSSATFRVIDPPLPPVAKSRKKHDILIGVVGLLAGVVISALALSAISGLDKTARTEEDIDEVLGVEVVASIGDVRRRRELGPGKAKTS